MTAFVAVASIHELVRGQGRLVQVNNKRVALFWVGDRYYAIDDVCPHRGGPLSEGDIEGEAVVCPWHGAIFDLATGAVRGYPAGADVTTYAVRVQGDQIEVAL